MPEAIISAKGTEAPTVRSGRFTSAQKTKIERRIAADADMELNRHIEDYKIQRNIIESNRQEELEQAETDEQENLIIAKYDQQRAAAKDTLNENLKHVADDVTKQAAQTVVREVETAKREAKRTDLMDDV